jgi:hypothetical protein
MTLPHLEPPKITQQGIASAFCAVCAAFDRLSLKKITIHLLRYFPLVITVAGQSQ